MEQASGNPEFGTDEGGLMPVVPKPPATTGGASAHRAESGGWSPTAWRAGSGTDPALVWQLGGSLVPTKSEDS